MVCEDEMDDLTEDGFRGVDRDDVLEGSIDEGVMMVEWEKYSVDKVEVKTGVVFDVEIATIDVLKLVAEINVRDRLL